MKNLVFKRLFPVFLVFVFCFSFAVPASALTFIPSRADATDISQRINTANITWAQAYGYYVGGPATAPNFNATAEIFDGYFISDFPTGDYSSYVFVSMDQLVELSSKCDFPVTLTFLPTLGIYIIIFDAEFGTSSSEGQREMALFEFGNLSNSALIYQSLPSSSTAVFPYRIVAAFAPNSEDDIPSDLNSSSSGTTDRNYYTDNSSSDTTINVDGSQTVTNIYQGGDTFQTDTFDYSNGTWYDNVSGTINNIETLKYNPVSNTYTINNTYNITYEYNYTYYYNLGSSENLVQDYKFYYELPDGRSSSDLTADEIAGLSLEFDVVNYAQDRTDENTKILVPFDGSWEDTAYNGPDLIWRTGASITYKESAAFNGALYIDGSNPSIFGFDAPWANQISTKGMTLQFRYYCDAFQTSSSYRNQSLIFVPFSYANAQGYAFSFPYFYIKPDGQIWFGVGSNYSTHIGDSNYINVSAGSLSSGVWSDITVSVVPSTSSGSVDIVLYINGQLVFSYRWPPSSYSGYYTRSISPVFSFNTTTLYFGSSPIPSADFVYKISFSSESDNMPYQMIDNLRMVDFALYDGSSSSNFVPTPVPFDTNLVYVLPDTTDLKDNTIAVQSGVPVSGYRIGGVRPTFPDEGMVWMPLENDKIADCQIYNGSYWESVGCRVWTGERWVPAWAFNVITLSDLWDMYGGEETDNYTEITPGSFFQWFQEQWYEFKTKLFELLGGGGGGSEPPSDCEHVYSSKITREPGCAQPGLKTYTCDKCKHSYTESIDATGHDWLTVDTVPEVLDEEGKVLEEGYDVLECSICGAESKDFGDGPVEEDLFDALGNFIADGITWILEKLTELADSLRAITDTFVDFTTRVGDLAGGFPLFFGAFVALIPEDLKTIMWFGLIGLIVLGVWKKWAR